MDYDFEDEASVADWVAAYVSARQSEFADHLGSLPFEDSQRARRLVAIGEALAGCLHSLKLDESLQEAVSAFLSEWVDDPEPTQEQVSRVVVSVQHGPVVRETLRFSLAHRAAEVLLAGAEERVPLLVGLAAYRRHSDRAAAFLDRATRLYLWGFGPEAVVMCASTIEAAYESRFTQLDMEGLGVVRSGNQYQAYEFERAAELAGVFDKSDRQIAAAIRRARNDILHNVPLAGITPPDAIRGATSLLDKLFPVSP